MLPLRKLLLALGVFAISLATWAVDPSAAQAERRHTVRSGDSLARIARRYHINSHDLAAANRLRSNSRIRPGQVLTVPDRGVVYVRSGQTLSHVAARNHCTVSALARANRMRTTSTLRVGQRLVLPGYVPPSRRNWGRPEEPGVVTVQRRGVEVHFRILDDEGHVSERGLRQLAALMVRHEEDAPGEPAARLAALVAKISDQFAGRRITIVSGFREARGFTNQTSQHVHGHATDIRVQGVPNRVVWDYCRSLSRTGCGYYPNSTFVHVDVRDRAAQWVDWSRPGRRPRYGNLSGPGRRRMQRSPVGRRITRPNVVPHEVTLFVEENSEPILSLAGQELEPHEETDFSSEPETSGEDSPPTDAPDPATGVALVPTPFHLPEISAFFQGA